MAEKLPRSCFVCLHKKEDLMPMMDETNEAEMPNGTSFRNAVVAKHFWFDINELQKGFICGRCWSKIEKFHHFYCEIEAAHEHKLNMPFAEVKDELSDVDGNAGEREEDEPEAYAYCFSQKLIKGETSGDGKLEIATVFVEEKRLFDKSEEEGVNETKGSDDDDDDDEEEEEEDDDDDDDDEKSKKVTITKKPCRRRLKLEDIAQVDEMIASYCNMHCDQCEQTFDTFNELQIHASSEHKRRAYVFCCDRRFNTRIRLYEHVQCHVNPSQFQCDICKRNFVDSEGVRRHKLNVHTSIEERPFKCEKCPKAFFQESEMNMHKRYHQALEQKEFSCDQCDKYFGNVHLLKQHVKNMHTSTIEYVCDHCAKGFNKKERFLHHLTKHGPKIPKDKAQCPICFRWLLKDSLKNHIVRHNSSTYRCETCGKESPNVLAHRSHVRNAHSSARLAKSNARFMCNFCCKIYKSALTLKEHVASHNKEVLYTCPHCPKTFYSNANMHSHRKKKHYQEWLATRRTIITKKIDDDQSNEKSEK